MNMNPAEMQRVFKFDNPFKSEANSLIPLSVIWVSLLIFSYILILFSKAFIISVFGILTKSGPLETPPFY